MSSAHNGETMLILLASRRSVEDMASTMISGKLSDSSIHLSDSYASSSPSALSPPLKRNSRVLMVNVLKFNSTKKMMLNTRQTRKSTFRNSNKKLLLRYEKCYTNLRLPKTRISLQLRNQGKSRQFQLVYDWIIQIVLY